MRIPEYDHILHVGSLLAVAAHQFDGPPRNFGSEGGPHRLVVGDADRVAAFDGADDGLGDGEPLLLHHFEVLDYVDRGVRGDESYVIQFLVFEAAVGYLYDDV